MEEGDLRVSRANQQESGLFLDYIASTVKYLTPLDNFIDFQNRRAIVVEGHEDAVMTLTPV